MAFPRAGFCCGRKQLCRHSPGRVRTADGASVECPQAGLSHQLTNSSNSHGASKDSRPVVSKEDERGVVLQAIQLVEAAGSVVLPATKRAAVYDGDASTIISLALVDERKRSRFAPQCTCGEQAGLQTPWPLTVALPPPQDQGCCFACHVRFDVVLYCAVALPFSPL